MGVAEAAEILHVSKQRVHAMTAQGLGFPPPVVELAAGPVFLRSAVEAFAARPRRAGRPTWVVKREDRGRPEYLTRDAAWATTATARTFASKESAEAAIPPGVPAIAVSQWETTT